MLAHLGKVAVNVVGARDQARNVAQSALVGKQNAREGGRKTPSRLRGAAVEHADVVVVGESERLLDAADGDVASNGNDVLVEGPANVIHVGEHERLGEIKAKGQNVGGVCNVVLANILDEEVLVVENLHVICEHEDEFGPESLLKPSVGGVSVRSFHERMQIKPFFFFRIRTG